MNKKGIFVPTLIILSILLFSYSFVRLSPIVSTDYKFKFLDVLNGEFRVNKNMFDNEQEIRYKAYEALEILFNDGICDWSVCNPLEEYESEFRSNFDKLYDGDYKVLFSGMKIDASKDIGYIKENLKINSKHVFSYTIDFDWNIVRELYESCKDVKNCNELGKCKAICKEDDKYLNFEYFIPLKFVKKLNFRIEKRGKVF